MYTESYFEIHLLLCIIHLICIVYHFKLLWGCTGLSSQTLYHTLQAVRRD